MKLVELPEEEPWTVKDFTDNTEELCALGAHELQTKSVNVEVSKNLFISKYTINPLFNLSTIMFYINFCY